MVTLPGPPLASNPCCPQILAGEAARAHPGPVTAGGAGPPACQRASAAPVCRTGQRHRALDPEQDGGGLVLQREHVTASKSVPKLPQPLLSTQCRENTVQVTWVLPWVGPGLLQPVHQFRGVGVRVGCWGRVHTHQRQARLFSLSSIHLVIKNADGSPSQFSASAGPRF